MSPFLIFFIAVTIIYVLYYAAIITVDMNAKPKDAVAQGETMEAPEGMQTTEDNDDSEEESTSREADDENDNDNPEGHSEDDTAGDHQDEDNIQSTYMNNGALPNSSAFEPESQPIDSEPEDDDVYGIDKQMQEQSEHHEAEPQPSSQEEQLPSNQKENQEQTPEQVPEETPESESDPTIDNGDTDEDDEEDLEALREQMRQHLAQVAQAEGAEMVDAEVPDNNEFEEERDDGFRGMVDAQNCDTGRADEINQNNEPIDAESMTLVRQDRFASTIMGAWNGFKKKEQDDKDKDKYKPEPSIDPDNIEKKENITKA